MYLLYLDESGDDNSWQVQDHFVLGGVAIFEGQIYRLSNEIDAIQKKYFPDIQIQIEFHASHIRNGKGRFRRFTRDTREEIFKDIYNIILNANFPNLIAFATTMHVSAVENSMQVRHDVLEEICKNYNNFLQSRFRVGRQTKGLLIIDRNREREYLRLFDEFKRFGTKDGILLDIVDIPYFADSNETRMLQIADFIANAVFQYYERDKSEQIEKILPRFYRISRYNPPVGLAHITNIEECQCLACSSRHYRRY